MCCESSEQWDLPPAAIAMIARYRGLLAERGWDWGDDQVEMFRWARFSRLGDVFTAFAETGDWPAAVRDVLGAEPPAGIVVVHLGEAGIDVRRGPTRLAIAGSATAVDVVLDSALDHDIELTIAGVTVRVAARGAAVRTLDVDGADPGVTVVLDAAPTVVSDVVRVVPAARLRLRADRCARWSVVDDSGGAWFPTGRLRKWDVHDRPFFHERDVELAVPAGTVRVACARGLEFERVERVVEADAGTVTDVECAPERLIDPAADGWYGGDLHIHMNYSGDLVCSPEDAARMQLGEGLQLANFVAGNCQTSLIYDRELLEQTAGRDLPWSSDAVVARMGVEYRNDLLGHVHALGPDGLPSLYATGHERSEHPEDWPPNLVACRELAGLGATVGYPHPVFTAFPEDWAIDPFLANPRSVEARELVVDAALGAVDSIDIVSPFDDEGAVFLYHRLLSCGLRLAATAGTDTFLSFSHGPGVASNPPGWGRVYAHLGGEALSVAAFKAAVRAGRTLATNGPWVTLDVDGHGPGAAIDASIGRRLTVAATVVGGGSDRLTLVGPDGPIAEGVDEVRTTIQVERPLWIAAVARGPGTDNTLDAAALAHTSPVFVDVDGHGVARAADARWCLELIDRVEQLLAEHGTFSHHERAERLSAYRAIFDDARAFYRNVVATAPR